MLMLNRSRHKADWTEAGSMTSSHDDDDNNDDDDDDDGDDDENDDLKKQVKAYSPAPQWGTAD